MLRQIHRIVEPLRSVKKQAILGFRALQSTSSDNIDPTTKVEVKETISKAMKAYLKRAQEHEQFMNVQQRDFELGKRHLANMMGENPDTLTQEAIDEAIEYLLPSGLYEKKARPLMKPPSEVFPQRKAAEFDQSGRPFHYLFYTGRPNFYEVMHQCVEKINELYKFEDSMNKKNLQPDPNLTLELSGSQWLQKEVLEQKILEPLSDRDYNSFISAMDRLCILPFSYRAKEFIMQYRKPLMNYSNIYDAIKPQVSEDGRQHVTVYECARKTARASVTLRSPGTGKVSINGQDITYFEGIQEREQVSLYSESICN